MTIPHQEGVVAMLGEGKGGMWHDGAECILIWLRARTYPEKDRAHVA